MKIFYQLLTVLLMPAFCVCQNSSLFQSTFGGSKLDRIVSIEKINENLYLLGGESESFVGAGGRDFLLNTMDINGNIIESWTFGTDDREILRKAFRLPSGSFLVAGLTTENNTGNVNDDWVVSRRNGVSGDEEWTRCWGSLDEDDQLEDAMISSDGDIVVCGHADGTTGPGGVILGRSGRVVKMRPDGDILWAKTFRDANTDASNWFTRVKETSDGILIAGYTDIADANDYNAFLTKVSPEGNFLWAKKYDDGTTSLSNAKYLETLDNGHIILVDNISINASDKDILVMRVNTSGNVVWARTYGGAQADACRFVKKASNGDIIIGGYSNSFTRAGEANDDGLLFRINQNGDVIWANAYGGAGIDRFSDIESYNQNGVTGYFLVGESNSFASDNTDAYVTKMGEDGMVCDDNSLFIQNIPIQNETRSVTVTSFGSFGLYSQNIEHTLFSSGLNVTATKHSQCGATSVNYVESNKLFSLFPNPASDNIHLSFNALSTIPERINFYDARGQLVKGHTMDSETTELDIDISDFVDGIYFMKIFKDNYFSHHKLIVQSR